MKVLRWTLVVVASVTCLVGGLTLPSHAATAKAVAVSLKNCKQTDGPKDGEEGDFATLLCSPAVGGWRVQIDYDDARESITLIRAGKSYPLDLWRVVDGRFSSVGDRFEFRVVNGKAVAGIVRFTHVIDDATNEKVSNLVVVRLSPTPCVVRVVPPSAGADQNAKARTLADRATAYSCVS